MSDITANYHGGNPESAAAFEETPAEQRRKQRTRVLSYIRGCGLDGATSDEAEVALGLTHQACSARFTELKADGTILKVLTRPTRSGRKAGVFVAAELLPF